MKKVDKMDKLFNCHKTLLVVVVAVLLLISCDFLQFVMGVPVIIKSSVHVTKPYYSQFYTTKSSQKHIFAMLKNSINSKRNSDIKKEEVDRRGGSEQKNINVIEQTSISFPLTPTTLKLKNAIRVKGYVGNKQIIPSAQQRQACQLLPIDVVAFDTFNVPNNTEDGKYTISNTIAYL